MDILSTFEEYVKPFKGCLRFHRWAMLSVMSATLERRVWYPRGGIETLYPNQYIVLCGPAGTGKTISSKLATKFLVKHNQTVKNGDSESNKQIHFGPDKVTPAALFLHMSKLATDVKTWPPSFKQSAVYLHSTEFSTMITDIGGGSLVHDLLKLWDCDDQFQKELIGMGQITIHGPCVNLLADTTPAFLSAFLPSEASGTGLTARMIFATNHSMVKKDAKVPEGNKELHDKILAHIARMHLMCGPFQMTLAADAFYETWFSEMQDKMATFPDGTFMRDFYNRKQDHVLKNAMAISAGRDSSRVIHEEDLQRAIEIIDEAEPLMDKSFGVTDLRRIANSVQVIVNLVPDDPQEVEESTLMQSLYSAGYAGDQKHFEGLINYALMGQLIKRRVDNNGRLFYARTRRWR